MAIIATNTSKLPVADKLVKGQDIIVKSTNNPDAPGNEDALAAFVLTQTDLDAAYAAYKACLTDCAERRSALADALASWNTGLTGLAGVTENVTLGDKTKILSTGFDVRGEPTPPQPLAAPTNVKVRTNGSPGVSKVSWKLRGADSFLVQMSPDPFTDESWEQVLVTTKSSCEVEGAEPGKCCWFRIAGVNAAGQGPWSAPACREVM